MASLDFNKIQLIGSLLLIAFVIGVIITTLVLTSIIWMPLFIVSSPLLIGVFFLVKFTKLRVYYDRYFYLIYEWLLFKSERPRKLIWGFIYNAMCVLYPQTQWKAMNYGYSVLGNLVNLIKNLSPEDEDERFCLQLYHYVATQCNSVKNLNGLKVLEVGSGRGGGLNYISKYLNPSACVGVDSSQNQIKFCKSEYIKNLKLAFYNGSSDLLEVIPAIEEDAFDMVLNIEKSHSYQNFDAFLTQAHRALKPQGILCFADFRSSQAAADLKKKLESHPLFKIQKYEDITINVLQSMKQDEKRKTSLIEGNVSSYLKPFFRKFSGLQGARICQEFEAKQTIYFTYILQKKLPEQ